MQYEPIKRSVGRFFSAKPLLRKILYSLLDLLLLRAWHVKRALRKLSSMLPYDASILDAGAGFGQYSWRVAKMNRDWKITAIDINPAHTEDCREFFSRAGRPGQVEFKTGDLTQLDDRDKYNLILSVDVMEHIADDTTVFSNFCTALKDKGFLVISTPSDQGGSDVHGEEEESFIDEHVRDGYSISDITEKLKKAGFSSVQASYTYGKPGNISWRLSMKYPVKLLNISHAFFIVLPFYYMVFFPVSLILNCLDLRIAHKKGTGLLVIAVK
jgi:2-polyprenyl-3-methyl-5-hydroxy-6-metoxy-1,4-benzoquinol methylase